MNIYLTTLGCRLNEAELETWGRSFQKAGHQLTRQVDQSNVIVLNSCAVTHSAVQKSKQQIRRLHRANPTAKIVLSGCYATLNDEEAKQLAGVDLVVSNKEKDQLVEKTLATVTPVTMPEMASNPGEVSLFKRGRQRAFIKVQDGCRYRCTFCIVTVARGQENSRSIATIVKEINQLCSEGIQEIVLTGVHLGGYGSDINKTLNQLIQAILEQTPIPRIRLGSLEPWDLSDDFFRLFENPRMMPHLHLPLQSGCDSVLRRMGRRCKTTDFIHLVNSARKQVTDFNLTTDIIVGFPGETKEEWQASLEYIEQIEFGHLHIFTYSPRSGTKAASLPSKIPPAVQKARSQTLHKLAATMKQKTYQKFLHQKYPILWESTVHEEASGSIKISGYTPNYLRVTTSIDDAVSLVNKIVPAKLMQARKDHLEASLF